MDPVKQRTRFTVWGGLAVMLFSIPTDLQAQILDSSTVWYADLLRQHFPEQIENGGSRFPRDEIATLPVDITTFNIDVRRSRSSVMVQGTVAIRALPNGISTANGAQGRRYMVHLDAFIFAPNGRVIWKQNGFPAGGAWIQADGETRQFILIKQPPQAIPAGSVLMVLASGDPLFGTARFVTRWILGAKTLRL